MAEADVNKTGSSSGQTPPTGTSGSSSGAAGAPPAGDARPPDSSPAVETDGANKQKLYVDGKEADEEAYFKAASKTYDVARLREMNYRPAINTEKSKA